MKAALTDKNRFTIVQCAPAVRYCRGIWRRAWNPYSGKIISSLHALGAMGMRYQLPADVTIMEERQSVKRVTEGGVLPMFTSCPACKIHEDNYPELKSFIFREKSTADRRSDFKT
ncbi:MAG: [Fe-Fe] hydrogenase large subunit C-terminal domain-containing protein [Clostridium sp.]